MAEFLSAGAFFIVYAILFAVSRFVDDKARRDALMAITDFSWRVAVALLLADIYHAL